MTKEVALSAKKQHPEALLLVHPECKEEVVQLADYAGSTAGIINFAKSSMNKEFIIGTELGVLCELKKQCPDKTFYPMSEELICSNMKKILIEKVRDCLKEENNEIILDENMMINANKPLEKMLELAS